MTFERLIDLRHLETPLLPAPGAATDRERLKQEVESIASRLADVEQAEAPKRSLLVAKRTVDVTVGTMIAIAVLPLILGLAVCVAVSARTWPFFVHRRAGRGGREFSFPKLRTLPSGTPPYASKYDLPTDIGRVAAFLRRTHLDELPQLLVVPLGWMSLVGPRPLMPVDFAGSPHWWVEARARFPQGCTGLWQISSHSHFLQHEAPEYDLFYARHASLRLDLWILLQTVRQFLRLGPPVHIGDVPDWAKNPRRAALEPEAAS